MPQVNDLDLDELLLDCDEIIRLIRRDRAYWTLWMVRGPKLRVLPDTVEALTCEQADGAPGTKPAPEPGQLARVRAVAERRAQQQDEESGAPARADATDYLARKQRRDGAFAAEFRRLREAHDHGEDR